MRRASSATLASFLALILPVAVSAGVGVSEPAGTRQPQNASTAVSIRIVSPADGDYVLDLVTLRAEITPPQAVARIEEVVFSVDGRVVCRLEASPLVCEWDAGRRGEAHVIRVVATLPTGRVEATIRTKALPLDETVDVDAVQVITVVTDTQGRFVKGLPREAFHLYEDDVEQKIAHFASENVPLELAAAIDMSGSMKPAMPQVKAAVRGFLLALQPGHEVSLLAFNENLFALSQRGTDPAVRARAVDRLAAWGSTALYDAIVYGFDILSQRPGRRALVVFTDGDDKVSHATVSSVIRRVESSDAALYMIGQGQAAHNAELQALLTRLAGISGGRAFFESDAGRLVPVFDDILEELSNQYLLTYQPRIPVEDDRWRSIRVDVDGPGYQVRARQGYRRRIEP
jgi:Ca-activated chloride channel family protein